MIKAPLLKTNKQTYKYMLFTRGTSKTKAKLNIKGRLTFKTAGQNDQGKANKQKAEAENVLIHCHSTRNRRHRNAQSYFILIKSRIHNETIMSFVMLQMNGESKHINKTWPNTKRLGITEADGAPGWLSQLSVRLRLRS